MRARTRPAAHLALLAPLLLAGCARQPLASSLGGTTLEGRVHGGQQAVAGATIFLYAAGSAGNGLGATNLLGAHVVTTDAFGNFTITNDYTCPSATTQVYLIARGGNPGLPNDTTNPALVMMTALGDCGALSQASFIFVNEVTTVAAAWSLAPFLANGALIGSSATNAIGLRNAFLSAANLANSATGLAPGSTLPTAAATETAKINSLANSLSNCVNSDGTTACNGLFTASTSAAGTPSNTLDAARAIVLNPGAHVGDVFNAAPTQPPFQPALVKSPNDWTLSVTYGGCNSGCGGLDLPGALAIDSTGSVWVANYFGAVVSKFSPAGVPAAANGFAGTGLHQSYGIAIDAQDNAWVTNEQSVASANNSRDGSVSKFSSAGAELSGYGFTAGQIFYPQAVAADSAGPIWIANYGASSATLLANDGTALSPSGYAEAALPFVSAVALDASHNAWFAAEKTVARVTPAGVTTTYTCCDYPSGIAVAANGSIWVADSGAASVYQLSASGTVLSQTTLDSGLIAPQLIAIDGAGNVWTSNYRGDSISELAQANGAVLSPAAGFGLDAPLNEPFGIAIDASGNLWTSNSNGNTITQFVGLAQPVHTPTLGPPAAP